jgi:hypothetical protein
MCRYHKENTETLTDDSKEVGLKVLQRKLSRFCCLLTTMQGKINYIYIANRYMEKMA